MVTIRWTKTIDYTMELDEGEFMALRNALDLVKQTARVNPAFISKFNLEKISEILEDMDEK